MGRLAQTLASTTRILSELDVSKHKAGGKSMDAMIASTKNKGSSLLMALRAVATERAVSFTNTAVRRG